MADNYRIATERGSREERLEDYLERVRAQVRSSAPVARVSVAVLEIIREYEQKDRRK